MRDKDAAAVLFGQSRRISATQVEMYHLCRFRYFCRYGLGAKERRRAQIDPMQYGSLIHYIFEHLFANGGSARVMELTEAQLRQEIAALVDGYAEENFGGQKDKTERFRSVLRRMVRSAAILVRHVAEELSQSRFSPVAFEQEVGGEQVPFEIPVPGGGQVRMTGSIDRVDAMEENGKTYVRVIDYKTGRKEFHLSDVLYGLNLQMLVYLAALIEQKTLSPAGVLYMPSMRPSVSSARGESDEKDIDKELRMNGVILGDGEEMIRCMEREAKGRYIPVSIKNNKIGGSQYLISREEFYEIASYIKNKIASMARTLREGDIDAQPLLVNHLGCDYCPYRSICGKEYEKSDVKTKKLSNEEIFEAIRREGNDGEKLDAGAAQRN